MVLWYKSVECKRGFCLDKDDNWMDIDELENYLLSLTRQKGCKEIYFFIFYGQRNSLDPYLKLWDIKTNWRGMGIGHFVGPWGVGLFFALGGIQVLRHQRGGWVGWPNDDV